MTRISNDIRGAEEATQAVDVPALRVDAAHEVRPETAALVDAASEARDGAVTASAVDCSFDAAAQIQRQAGQLAAHLVARQRELDRREATLHAQAAQWERDCANERLASEERAQSHRQVDDELAQRAATLAARERAIGQRETELRSVQVENEYFLQRQEEELELRESQVALVEERLANEQRVVGQLSKELQQARERFRLSARRLRQQQQRRCLEWERSTHCVLETLERRRARIEAEARSAGAAPADTEPTDREEIEQLRAALRMELLAVRRLLDEREVEAAESARTRAESLAMINAETERLGTRERGLASRAEEIEAGILELDQAREQVAEQRRAALAERLAAEELWARIAPAGGSGGLQGPLSTAKARLAEAEHAKADRWNARAAELESLRLSLAEEHARLTRQQLDQETAAADRERVLAEQTRALARRTEELDRRTAKLAREEIQSRLDRLQARN